MSLSQKTKESIADALFLAIQDAAALESRKCTTRPSHYGVIIDESGYVQFYFITGEEPTPLSEGWILLEE